MQPQNHPEKHHFLNPQHRYRGNFTPQNMLFNANLQEFSQQVGYISALETGGKLDPKDAYKQVKHLWKELKRSYRQIELDN